MKREEIRKLVTNLIESVAALYENDEENDEETFDEAKEKDSGIQLNKIVKGVDSSWWLTVSGGGDTSKLKPENCWLYPGKKVIGGTTKLWKRGAARGLGTTIMWPEYIFAIKNNDEIAMQKITDLGLPLDLEKYFPELKGMDYEKYFVDGAPEPLKEEKEPEEKPEEKEQVDEDGAPGTRQPVKNNKELVDRYENAIFNHVQELEDEGESDLATEFENDYPRLASVLYDSSRDEVVFKMNKPLREYTDDMDEIEMIFGYIFGPRNLETAWDMANKADCDGGDEIRIPANIVSEFVTVESKQEEKPEEKEQVDEAEKADRKISNKIRKLLTDAQPDGKNPFFSSACRSKLIQVYPVRDRVEIIYQTQEAEPEKVKEEILNLFETKLDEFKDIKIRLIISDSSNNVEGYEITNGKLSTEKEPGKEKAPETNKTSASWDDTVDQIPDIVEKIADETGNGDFDDGDGYWVTPNTDWCYRIMYYGTKLKNVDKLEKLCKEYEQQIPGSSFEFHDAEDEDDESSITCLLSKTEGHYNESVENEKSPVNFMELESPEEVDEKVKTEEDVFEFWFQTWDSNYNVNRDELHKAFETGLKGGTAPTGSEFVEEMYDIGKKIKEKGLQSQIDVIKETFSDLM